MIGTERVSIRRLLPEDAPALVRSFERCYGRTYPVPDFYDPAATRARVRAGSLRSVVAVTSGGEIVGHVGLTIRDPCARTVDAGNSIVDPEYRGQGLIARLAAAVADLARDEGFLGFHHYPTTVHPIMQKLAVDRGGIETGIMLDYIPSGTEFRGFTDGPRRDRLAVVVVYQPLAPAPARLIFPPPVLETPIREIYARAAIERIVERGAHSLAQRATRIRSSYDERRGLLRIEVSETGEDLRELVRHASSGLDAPVTQIDVRMNEPSTPAAVEALRELGFFFSAVLPEYLDGDMLRLQRIASDATRASPDLVTAEARALLATIDADRLRAASLRSPAS